MLTLDDRPLALEDLDGLLDLDWATPSLVLALLKVLSLAMLAAVYLAKRRRGRILEASIEKLSNNLRARAASGAAADAPPARAAALGGQGRRRRTTIRPVRR